MVIKFMSDVIADTIRIVNVVIYADNILLRLRLYFFNGDLLALDGQDSKTDSELDRMGPGKRFEILSYLFCLDLMQKDGYVTDSSNMFEAVNEKQRNYQGTNSGAWTDPDINILKTHFLKENLPDLQIILGRTRKAIQDKARILGLKSKKSTTKIKIK